MSFVRAAESVFPALRQTDGAVTVCCVLTVLRPAPADTVALNVMTCVRNALNTVPNVTMSFVPRAIFAESVREMTVGARNVAPAENVSRSVMIADLYALTVPKAFAQSVESALTVRVRCVPIAEYAPTVRTLCARSVITAMSVPQTFA